MRDLLIIALDFDSENHAPDFLDRFNEPPFVKVGMKLYYQTGSALIERVKEHGRDIFLDPKLHDTLNIVQKTMEGLGKLNINLVNVHAAGGTEVMKHAVKGLRKYNKTTKMIAVTQLASTTEEMFHQEQNIQTPTKEAVLNHAKLVRESGLDDVVCSPSEAKLLTRSLGSESLRVTSGIRPKGAAVNDQEHITTPEDAKQSGSTHIVVSRLITQNEHPQESYTKIEESWLG